MNSGIVGEQPHLSIGWNRDRGAQSGDVTPGKTGCDLHLRLHRNGAEEGACRTGWARRALGSCGSFRPRIALRPLGPLWSLRAGIALRAGGTRWTGWSFGPLIAL